MSFTFQNEGIILEYKVIGKGEKVMLAFHGFSNSAEMFKVFEPSLGKKFTVYSFNLPYHGKSTISEEYSMHGISEQSFKNYINGFLQHIKQKNFSLLGFSIGGKLALKLIELFPENIQHVFLFAPDGIKVSFWYRFVTRTSPGKWIYKRLMRYPARYLRIVGFLERIGVVPHHTANFVRDSLNTAEKREMVYKTWMSLKHLDPDSARLHRIINEKNLDLHLFFGKYDKLIPPHIGKKFMNGIRTKSCLHILDSGHMLIKDKTNAHLEKILSA